MTISIIAAIGKNRELGKNNKLLWHIPEDLKKFKTLTSGHIVIMGRKTYESIGKPLPNRVNIVITRNRSRRPLGCTVCYSLEEAVKNSKRNLPAGRQVFIIGGAEIYKQGIQYADKLYLTLVNQEYPEADAFFPDYSEFSKVVNTEEKKLKGLNLRWVELERSKIHHNSIDK